MRTDFHIIFPKKNCYFCDFFLMFSGGFGQAQFLKSNEILHLCHVVPFFLNLKYLTCFGTSLLMSKWWIFNCLLNTRRSCKAIPLPCKNSREWKICGEKQNTYLTSNSEGSKTWRKALVQIQRKNTEGGTKAEGGWRETEIIERTNMKKWKKKIRGKLDRNTDLSDLEEF